MEGRLPITHNILQLNGIF